MILSIILLVIVVLIVAILLMFLFYILFPSIHNQNKIKENPILADNEVNYIKSVHIDSEKSDMKAVVLCSCEKKFDIKRKIFNESYSCSLVYKYSGTGTPCKFSCIGLGDCKKSCPQHAIYIKNNTAVISNLCTGCGKCVDICPLNIIRLIPKNTKEYTLCANKSDEKSGCSEELKTQKVVWNEKKYFKIWATCYRIFKSIIKN